MQTMEKYAQNARDDEHEISNIFHNDNKTVLTLFKQQIAKIEATHTKLSLIESCPLIKPS